MGNRLPKRKFDFGVSFAYGPGSADAVSCSLNRSVFSSIELTDAMALDGEISGLVDDYGVAKVQVCDLFSLPLTRSMAGQSKSIISEFVKKFCNFLDRAEQELFDSFTIDFELETFGDSDLMDEKVSLLKRLGQKLHDRGVTLCLPVRIPQVGGHSTEFYLSCLKKVMCPNIQLCIDIHPHELKRGFSVINLLKWIQFDIHTIRFIYEPEAGNFLVDDIITTWTDFLRTRYFSGSVIFAPVISDEAFFCSEVDSLQDILCRVDSDKLNTDTDGSDL